MAQHSGNRDSEPTHKSAEAKSEQSESKSSKIEQRAENRERSEAAEYISSGKLNEHEQKVQQKKFKSGSSTVTGLGKTNEGNDGFPSAKDVFGSAKNQAALRDAWRDSAFKEKGYGDPNDLQGAAKPAHPDTKLAGSVEKSVESHPDSVNPIEWLSHGGDTLARQVAESTKHGGLMLLGPADTMRGEAGNYKDPDGYFPVFTHASPSDFHLYYGLHGGRKEYGVETMAELIKKHVPEGQPIRLLGCESGLDGKDGIAHQLARLLPNNPVYAPDGYCQLKDGEAIVYTKKPSEMEHLYQEPPRGGFVLIKP